MANIANTTTIAIIANQPWLLPIFANIAKLIFGVAWATYSRGHKCYLHQAGAIDSHHAASAPNIGRIYKT